LSGTGGSARSRPQMTRMGYCGPRSLRLNWSRTPGNRGDAKCRQSRPQKPNYARCSKPNSRGSAARSRPRMGFATRSTSQRKKRPSSPRSRPKPSVSSARSGRPWPTTDIPERQRLFRGGPEPRATLGFRAHEPLGLPANREDGKWRCHEPERSEWFMVGEAGFEPATSASRTLRAKPAALLPDGNDYTSPCPPAPEDTQACREFCAPMGTIICMAGRRSARLAYPASPRKVARPKHYLVVIALYTVGVLAVTASANILQAQLTQSTSKRVLVNAFSWYGFELDLQFRQLHEAEALDVVRSALLTEKRISDLPVLVRGEGPGFEFGSDLTLPNSRSSIEDACGVYPDGEAASENV